MSQHTDPPPAEARDDETLIDLRAGAAPLRVRRRHLYGRPPADSGMSDLRRYRDSHTRPLSADPDGALSPTVPVERSIPPAPALPATSTSVTPTPAPPEPAGPAPGTRRRRKSSDPRLSSVDVARRVDAPSSVDPDVRHAPAVVVPGPPVATVTSPGDLLVVQRVRLWSVVKMATVLYVSGLLVMMVAGFILWSVAEREGWVSNWTDFLVAIGFEGATIDGGIMLRASAVIGLVLVATAVALTVAVAIVYNQFSALLGGVELSFRPRHRRPRRWGRRRPPEASS